MSAKEPQIFAANMGNGMVVTILTAQLLQETEIASIEEAILQIVKQAKVPNIVLDFENVKFLSSAALRVLIKVNSAIEERHGKLRLCSIDPKILEVFKITRLNKVFDIQKNTETAVESLK